MEIAAATSGRTAAQVSRRSPGQFAAAVACVAIASWLPVLVGATSRALVGWVVAVALAIGVEWLTRRFSAAVLVGGLLASSALVPSGLVTDSTRYMPVAVTGGALALRIALDAWRGRRLISPAPRSVLVAVGLYLAWAAVTTVTSADHRVSAVYLVGMVVVCALAFWAIPAMLSEKLDRDWLLATLGALGVVLAFSVYLVSVVAHISVFGREIGLYQLADLTIGGHATGLLFGRSSGIDLAPLEASVLMAIGVGALLGWSSTRSGRPLLLARLGIAFMVPAILMTLSRSAWLTAIVAAGVFAVLAAAAKLPARTAAIVCIVLASTFLLVFVGAIGVNAVGSVCTSNCPVSGGDETPLRGATGLSGREYLWKASVLAIEQRPVVGFGPGNNVPALNPYLGGGGVHIQGLTSHSAWLRTGVEMGIPGLALLLGVLAVVGLVFMRGLRAAIRDPIHLAIGATVCGLLPAMTFESFLLGGVTFSNLYLAVGLGLMVAPLTQAAASAPARRPAIA